MVTSRISIKAFTTIINIVPSALIPTSTKRCIDVILCTKMLEHTTRSGHPKVIAQSQHQSCSYRCPCFNCLSYFGNIIVSVKNYGRKKSLVFSGSWKLAQPLTSQSIFKCSTLLDPQHQDMNLISTGSWPQHELQKAGFAET
jgi:hypothetical protein